MNMSVYPPPHLTAARNRISQEVLKKLMVIPGVGTSLAADLYLLGIREVRQMKSRQPEKLYERLCKLTGQRVDRCVLYVFRCAVYFASTKRPDPEKLKWWNWKD